MRKGESVKISSQNKGGAGGGGQDLELKKLIQSWFRVGKNDERGHKKGKPIYQANQARK